MIDEDKKESSSAQASKDEEKTGETKNEAEKSEETDAKVEEKAEEASNEANESAGSKESKEEDKKEEPSEPGKPQEQAKPEEPKPEPKLSSRAQVEGKEVEVSGKLADIIKNIETLSVLELSDLVKALEEKFGVTAAAPVTVTAGATPTSEAAEGGPEEGQTTFNVILTEAGVNKISSIKAVRELVPTLGLKEAKDLVDAAPKQVLEGVGKEAAGEAKQKLEAAGSKVELK